MIKILRKLEFDYGHRVLGHEGKCRHLHGHRGVAEIVLTSPAFELDNLGRVLDYGIVKTVVGKWINDNWDHNLLLNSQDPLLYGSRLEGERAPYVFAGKNPTAENMARELYDVVCNLLPDSLVERVGIWETPNCYAEYKP